MPRTAAPKPRPCILVDQREQAPLVFSEAVDTELVTLVAGDYSLRGCSDLVAIERKRLGELATCCGTERDRFLAQVESLRAFPVRALVVEGDLDGVLSKSYSSEIHPLSVLGTLVKFSADWQIPIWMCGDARNTATVVERMLVRVFKQQLERAQVLLAAGA